MKNSLASRSVIWFCVLSALPGLLRADSCLPARLAQLVPVGDDLTISGPSRADFYYPQSNTNFLSRIYDISVPTFSGGRHRIQLAIPYEDSNYTEQLKNGIVSLVRQLPRYHISVTHTIRVNAADSINDTFWRQLYSNVGFIRAAGSAGDGNIDLFPCSHSCFVGYVEQGLKYLFHEHGHNFAVRIWKSVHPPADWVTPARADRNIATEYARASWAEDFAETFMTYLNSLRTGVPVAGLEKRFARLDHLFGVTGRGQNLRISNAGIQKLNRVISNSLHRQKSLSGNVSGGQGARGFSRRQSMIINTAYYTVVTTIFGGYILLVTSRLWRPLVGFGGNEPAEPVSQPGKSPVLTQPPSQSR